MVVAAILLLVLLASVLFHFFTPWWLTPLASNWSNVDTTLAITIAITGVFFVAVTLFVIYAVWRFRHREGTRATFVADNKKLEHGLIAITTLGIIALLAPGLVAYAAYVSPPADAMTLEIVGQQWRWRYRLPGDSGKIGASDVRFVSATNPLGLDPADPAAQDNRVVDDNEVHLPVGKPVKVILRSYDVLHDYFVPQFRARMNIVPGQVSWFWFTPTRPGRYEAMCAQLCGVGHPDMRGFVVVEDEAAFKAWLAKQPTFAQTQQPKPAAPAASGAGGDLVAQGRALAQGKGCVACHTIDGSPGVGPTWKGLYGKTEQFDDGSSAKVDEAYLRGFIRNPQQGRNVKGFAPVMPPIPLTDDELTALVAHIKSLGAP